jgi:uncharacterized metal-binding protein YceD (DUF177 family)
LFQLDGLLALKDNLSVPLPWGRDGSGVVAVEPVRDNLEFSLEAWPEVGVSVDFVLSPGALLAAMKREGGELDPAAGEAMESLVFKTAMRGRLDIQVFNRRVKVKGAFAVKLEFACARCLEPFVGKIADRVDETLLLAENAQDSDPQWDGALSVSGGVFDLAPLMAELFWLAWPQKALCKPDCAGLCPECGANLNEPSSCSCGRGRGATRH